MNAVKVKQLYTKKLDPRISIIVLILLNISLSMAVGLFSELFALAIATASSLYSRRYISILRWILAFSIFILLGYLCAIVPNQLLISFSATFIVYRRVIPIMMFAANFIATTCLGELAYGLQFFKLKPKLIVSICVAFRFLPTLAEEFIAIKDAMKSRGKSFEIVDFLLHPVKTVAALLIPLIAHVGIIADELGNSIMVRGAETSEPRTSYREITISLFDYLIFCLCIALFIFSLLSRLGVNLW